MFGLWDGEMKYFGINNLHMYKGMLQGKGGPENPVFPYCLL